MVWRNLEWQVSLSGDWQGSGRLLWVIVEALGDELQVKAEFPERAEDIYNIMGSDRDDVIGQVMIDMHR